MRKYRTSRKVWAVVLTLVMVLGMIPPVPVTAVGADAVVRTADPSTMNDYVDLFLNSDTLGVELSTENAGGVWTDKSVFAANAVPSELTGATSELNTKISMEDTGDNFLVALSAIASNKEIVGYSTRPTDTMLVLDLSGSMSGSTGTMVSAANKAIGDLLALNEHNRVGVVLYSGYGNNGNSTVSTATVLMPLDRYTTTSKTYDNVPLYISCNSNQEVSVSTGVSPRENLGGKKGTSGGTYTQNGIYKAMNQLVDADEKVIPEGSIQAGTTRLPIMVLMTDGEPTAATRNYTINETSNVGTGSAGKNYQSDMTFLTQLTMAYAKREIDTAYATGSLVYTLGYSVSNNNHAKSVMDPEAYTTDRIDTLWDTFLSTDAGKTFTINAESYQNKVVTKHTDPAGKYTKDLEDYRYYTDEYFEADRASDLTAAFQSIVNEIILQSKYYPTYVEKDHDHDGYITFTDKIGGYMEVTDVKGIIIGDTLFSGEKLARMFAEGTLFGTVQNPSDLGNELVWSVMERLHIDSAATARSLLNNAYNYGQMGVAADGSWSNYIGWYSDENGKFLNFYDESLTTDVPEGATHIIKSYGMLGQTDEAHGISAEDMMYASIRITQELDDYDQDGIPGETFLTWQIPASLIPTITYQVAVNTNAAGEITSVNKVGLENANVKPIRLLYEVKLREDIHEWNIAGKVTEAYRDNTANKDAGYVFYTNQWKKENGTTDTTRNAYSHFEPSIQNEWYYYTEDAIIYTNQNGTEYTGAAAPSTSGTYYRAYQVYEKLETGAYRTHTHYEQISADSLAKAKASGNNWVIPKGTVFRFWDPFQNTKSENNTATHAYSEYPTIVYDETAGHYYAYDVLGNNGKLTVTPATGIKLTKTLNEVVDGAANSFTFVIEGGSGNATLIRLDANGEPTSRTPLTFTDGKVEVTLAADETVYIIGLADGVTYTVTEKNHEEYRVSAVTVNGQAITGTAAQITAVAQTIQSAAFENTARGYGDLYITKSIESDHNIPDDIAAQTFQILVNVGTDLAGEELTVKLTDMTDPTKDVTTTATVTEEGNIQLALANTQTAKILSLPEDTVVTVTETLSDEQQAYFTYTVKTRDHSGAEEEADNVAVIHKNQRSTATVSNEYNPVPTKLNVSFNGTKNFDAEKMTEDATFTFLLQQYIGDGWANVDTASVTIKAGTEDASEYFNFDSLELTFTEEGTYSCQILEDVGTNTDITYDRSIYTFTVVVTDNGGKLEAEIVANVESGDEANFGATEDTDVDWTVTTVFNNEYHTTATNIDIVKTIEDKAGTNKTGQGFVMESYNASVDAEGVWSLGSLIRSATTDAKGEVRLVRNYDNTDFETNDTDADNVVTYHFIIKEKNDGLNGWTYDNTHYLVTVVLTRTVGTDGTESITAEFTIHKGVAAADGTFTPGEEVTVSGDTATITFTNTFDPTDVPVDLNIVPTVMKELDGRDLNADEFTFHIYADGDRETVLSTGTNDADGKVTFNKNLTFDKVGTYHYDVVEEKGSLGGVTYDETVYDMVVVVTEANGVLSADYYFQDSTTKTATFHNTYDAADTSIVIEGLKALTGKPMLNGEFRFNLVQVTDATGATAVQGGVTRTAANNPDDNGDQTAGFIFDAIPYTTTGEYFYAITEVGAGTTVNGVTYTEKTAVVKVTVTDPGDGTLKAVSEVVAGGDLTFNNTYVPLPTQTNLSSSKQLDGRVMIDGEFSFTLTEKNDDTYATDKSGGVKETVNNDADGKIIFSTIHFDKAGDYYYVIEEAQGTAGGVTYDETLYQIHISVVDDHKGKLVPTTTITQITTDDAGQQVATKVDTISFYNDYTIDGDGDLTLSGTKTLTGSRPTALQAGEFSFGLFDSQGDLVEEVTNDADGNFSFTTLTYDETNVGQTYTYQVREILPEVNGQKVTNYHGITYDTTIYEVEITISDDGVGGITVNHTVNGTDAAITFTNAYDVGGHDHVEISGTKKLTGRGMTAGEFTFGLFDDKGQPVKDAQGNDIVVTNDASGAFTFSALSYDAADKGKTYTYTVKEIIPEEAVNNVYKGVTYDTSVFTVVVTVVDNGQGSVDASYTVNGSAFTHIAFKNTYKAASTEHVLKATKIYDKGLKGNDFTFTLEGEIDGTEVSQTKKNDADGNIFFDTLTFTKEGTYEFTVKEIEKVLGFINYSEAEYKIVVTVTDNEHGELETEVLVNTVKDGKIEFTNKYQYLDADDEVTLSGTKKLTGFRTQTKAGEFTFGLYDSNGDLIEKVTNATDGSFAFPTLTYGPQDVGTKTYTVKEIIPEDAVENKLNGYTYDDTVYTITVTVIDDNKGNIVATKTITGAEDIVFTNKYEVKEAEVTLKGTKTYDKPLAGDDFTFSLEGEIDGTKVSQTKKNAKDGSITFDTLTFTKEGEYDFTVKEQAEALGFIQYAKEVYKVQITVTDDGKGQLVAAITVNDKADGKMEFVNDYTMLDAENELTITGNKTLVGRDLVAGEFSFGLYDETGKLLETVTNDASGKFTFSKLAYQVKENEASTYTYTVKEIAGSDPTVTYDETVYTVVVNVSDDNKGGTQLTYTVNETANGAITFSNVYTKPADVVANIYIQKNVVNKTESGIGLKDFTFVMTHGDTAVEVKSDEQGKAGFQVTFEADDIGKAFEYKVSEKKGSTAGMTYDTTVHTVTVKVSQNADGSLALTINDQATDSISLSFTNTYEESGTPATGDSFPIMLLGALMLLSAAGIAVLLMSKFRYRGKYSA